MLRELFPRGYPRYERSRFVQEIEAFSTWLDAKGYSRECIRGHLFRLTDSLERFDPVKSPSVYAIAQLKAAFDADCIGTRRSMLYRATRHAYQNFLSSQGRLTVEPVDERFATLRCRYRQELLDLRGLSNETIKQHERTINDFLTRMLPMSQCLRSLTSEDIDRYLTLKSQGGSRQYVQHVVAHLRAFLRFCHTHGEIDVPLHVIDTPRIHGDELPPRALAWPLVQALLRSVDRSSRSGWRDYTLLHLMAYYGLRPCEIISLRLDSIDWHAGILIVEQSKTQSTLTLPLADRTVSILQRYLVSGRPHTSLPHLFLRARGPVGALKRYAISDIFKKRATQSGLPIAGYSAYSLRHAFAMRLLKRGVGLKTIGDLLGHRNLASTCQYLRLDLDMLREVALPVPTQAQG